MRTTPLRSGYPLGLLFLIFSTLLAACGDSATPATNPSALAPGEKAAKPAEIRLDYAYYNPSSLALKKFGWLEKELATDNVPVKWVYSAGSNKANEFVSGNSLDFGSTAGAAALLARSNGVPLKTVYIYSKPEWTALVVGGSSNITKVSDLKGKKIAVTRGTDPFFFLLRTLKDAGLSQSDVEIVNLQHADGRTALQRGNVDAWSGLDPHMAAAELEDGAKIIYRNIDYNTYGTLNAREDFIQRYPDYTGKVIAQYERARQWVIANPDDAAQLLADEARLSLAVAKRELTERTVLNKNTGVPGDVHLSALKAVVPTLINEKLVADGSDPAKALDSLFNPTFAAGVIK